MYYIIYFIKQEAIFPGERDECVTDVKWWWWMRWNV